MGCETSKEETPTGYEPLVGGAPKGNGGWAETTRLGVTAQKQMVLDATGAAKRIEAQHRVEIAMEPMGRRGDFLVVKGTQADVEAARQAMEEVLHLDVPRDDLWTFVMEVPPAQYAEVMGKGNETVRRLEREGRAEVNVVPGTGVVVKGSEAACQATVGLIEIMIGAVRVKRSRGGGGQKMSERCERLAAADLKEEVARPLFFPSRTEEADGYKTADVLLRYLAAAKASLDICVPVVSSPKLAGALIHAQRERGVRVRVIVDGAKGLRPVSVPPAVDRRGHKAAKPAEAADASPTFEESLVPKLKAAGVNCLWAKGGAAAQYRMDHAYALIDQTVVASGSLAFTTAALTRQDENLCIVSEPNAVAAFARCFETHWVGTERGDGGVVGAVPAEEYETQHVAVQVFSPAAPPMQLATRVLVFPNRVVDEAIGRCTLDVLLAHLAGAVRTLDVAARTITCESIAATLAAAADRGVAVRVMGDAEAMDGAARASYDVLARRQVDCRPHARPVSNTYAVVDGALLLYGSLEWSDVGVFAAHAALTMTSHPDTVAAYAERFAHQFTRLRARKAYF